MLPLNVGEKAARNAAGEVCILPQNFNLQTSDKFHENITSAVKFDDVKPRSVVTSVLNCFSSHPVSAAFEKQKQGNGHRDQNPMGCMGCGGSCQLSVGWLACQSCRCLNLRSYDMHHRGFLAEFFGSSAIAIWIAVPQAEPRSGLEKGTLQTFAGFVSVSSTFVRIRLLT